MDNMENSYTKRDYIYISLITFGVLAGIAGVVLLGCEITLIGGIVLGAGLAFAIICFILYRALMPRNVKAERELKKKENLERKERIASELEEREEWKRTHIKKAIIVATRVGKDNGSAIIRGVVGDALAGTSGAVIGTSTAKQKQFTTFLLVYEDDTRETKEVENDSPLYKEYINYIEI